MAYAIGILEAVTSWPRWRWMPASPKSDGAGPGAAVEDEMGPEEEADPGRGGPLPDRGPGLPHPPQGPTAPAASGQSPATAPHTHPRCQ